jgi:hypothetical protein
VTKIEKIALFVLFLLFMLTQSTRSTKMRWGMGEKNEAEAQPNNWYFSIQSH